jgi:hypothetical protein
VTITQGLPDFQDIFLDDLRVYIRFRPKGFEYFILGYEPICMLDKVAQYIKTFWGERHTIFSVPQAVVHGVEPEGMELFHYAGPLRFSHRASGFGESTPLT